MFVKIFADMLYSSVWAEDSDTRIVWVTLRPIPPHTGPEKKT